MKRLPLFLLTASLLACGKPLHAELRIDSNKKPNQVTKMLEPLFESVVRPYNKAHAVEFGGAFPTKISSYPHFSNSSFAWIFDGKTLYSNVSAYVPEIASLENCKPDPDELVPGSRCDWQQKRFLVCHLFMFSDPSLKLETVARLNIARDKKQLVGLPRCQSVQAMAIAKTIPDAMLITLGYVDSAEPADKNSDPQEYSTTLLLRFKDENGKLKIEQDDRCLGNPNQYSTIAAARKVLAHCTAGGK